MTVLVSRDPLYVRLLDLDLPQCDYAVFGSGPMFAHGLLESPNDIDIIARGMAWERLKEVAVTFGREVSSEHLELFMGKIEAFSTWEPGEWDVDELIDSAEFIDGVPFVPLHLVLRWKQRIGRPKDALHCRIIEDYFRLAR